MSFKLSRLNFTVAPVVCVQRRHWVRRRPRRHLTKTHKARSEASHLIWVRALVIVSWDYYFFLKGQCHDVQWFFALFFCASKKWWLFAQMSRTSYHDSSVSPREQLRRPSWVEQMPFSSMFSAALPCRRHYFSPHKMASKNHQLYRDTAALKKKERNLLLWFSCGRRGCT